MAIKNSTLFLYLAAVSFVFGSSAYVKSISKVGLLIDVIQLVVLAYCFFKLNDRRRVGTYFWIVTGFYLLLGISTVLGTKQYLTYVVYTVQALSATVFVKYGIEFQPKKIFAVMRNVLIAVIVLNFVLMQLFPNGVTVISGMRYHFLGNRIAFTPFLMAALFFSFVQDYVKGRRGMSKITVAAIVICYFTALVEQVSTGIVAITVVMLLMVLFSKTNIRIDLSVFYVIYAIVFVAIVVFNIQYHIPFFTYLLVDILHEDLTFDNRTVIWAAAIKNFLKKPLLGYGLAGGGSITVQFEYAVKTLTAHNQVLNILYEGGVAAFAAFLAFCYNIANAVKKHKTDKIARVCTAFVIGFFFVMFTEVQMEKSIIFLAFATAANVPAIMRGKSEKFDVM